MKMQQITDKIIEARQDELIASTAALVRIPSVKSAPAPNAPFGEEIRRALDYTLALCRRLGLDAHDVDGYAGYAEIPGAQGEQIGVLTHLDVVPAGDGWSFPPFGAQLFAGANVRPRHVRRQRPAGSALSMRWRRSRKPAFR